MKGMVIFSGSSNPDLARKIAEYHKMPLGEIEISRFSEGEIFVRVKQDIRGRDVFIVQSTCPPPNENIMELLIIMDAIRRASPERLTVVLPYYGYARQDRKDQPRVPITAKLMANLITAAGANRILTMDLHADQIQGFFDIPVDHLTGVPLLATYFKENLYDDLKENGVVVVAPDVGGVVRARRFAVFLNADLAIVDKRRSHEVANLCEVMDIIGDVRGKVAVLVDDIVDTAGTLCNAAEGLKERGATRVFACSTHPVLSGPAVERLKASEIDELIVTDTIRLSEEKKLDKIIQLSIAPLFAEAILRVHSDRSVSSLFD